MRSLSRRTAADVPSRHAPRRPALPLLGTVLVAALTAMAGLPLAGSARPASAQPATSLAASGVTSTGATLTVSGHTGVWHWARAPLNGGGGGAN